MARTRKTLLEMPTKKIQLVLSAEEEERYKEIIRRAHRRNKLADLADVNRRLLMITKDQDLLTNADLTYFQGVETQAASTTIAALPVNDVEGKSATKKARKGGKNGGR